MLIDLRLNSSDVVIVGAGKVGQRKAKSLLPECRTLTVVSDHFAKEARRLEAEGVRLVKADLRDTEALDKLLSKSDLVIAATNDYALNRRIAERARAKGVLIGSVDDPSDSDFNFPAVRAVGNIRVGVTTGGRSPAMARLICIKLAKEISPEDRLRVELLGQLRKSTKRDLPSPAARKAAVYRVLRDRRVLGLLQRRRYDEAKLVAKGILVGE